MKTLKEPFDGNFHPDLQGQELKETYDFKCPECGYKQFLKPSIGMRTWGSNFGAGSCLQCKTFLELEINNTNDGANARVWTVKEKVGIENEDA